MRLNKFLSKAGISSRRGADLLLEQGRVAVNDKIITKLGTVIDQERDLVTVDGKPVTLIEEYCYLVVNKPPGYLVTCKDNFNRPIVTDLIGKYKNVARPVGRLDYDSSGLLILTNDGELAFRLSHPRYEIDKIYLVKCGGKISDSDMARLAGGIELDDGVTAPAKIKPVSIGEAFSEFYITIHEGRKRQIRRMCEAVGKKVVTLKRVAIGNIELGDLKSGSYRHLDKKEVASLMKAVGL